MALSQLWVTESWQSSIAKSRPTLAPAHTRYAKLAVADHVADRRRGLPAIGDLDAVSESFLLQMIYDPLPGKGWETDTGTGVNVETEDPVGVLGCQGSDLFLPKLAIPLWVSTSERLSVESRVSEVTIPRPHVSILLLSN